MATRSSLAPPARLYAGDSWAWEIPDSVAYPSAEFLLRYALAPERGGAPILVEPAALGTLLAFAVPATATASLAPGRWRWTLAASDLAIEGARATIEAGEFEVLPDPMAALGGDARSQARRILDAIEATIEGRATKDAAQYTIEGRSITRTPLPELLKARDVYRRMVRRESGASPIEWRKVRFSDG